MLDAESTSPRFTRRRVLVFSLTAGILTAACGGSSAPTTTPKAVATTPPVQATVAPPTAPAKSEPAKPAATPAAAKPAPDKNANWQAEWEKRLAAAKQEGKVAVAGPPGAAYREALMKFQEKYPEIQVEFTAASGRDFAPKVIAERRGGQYLWDVFIGGSNTGMGDLRPNGVLAPLRPILILPDVNDDSKWMGGLAGGFQDKESTYVFAFQARLIPNVWINRDSISEAELSTPEQLTDPKWKGKISWNDPRASGAGSVIAAQWLIQKGEDWLKQLFAQDVTITTDVRQQIEWCVRDRYPIAIGGDVIFVKQFQDEGIGFGVKPLAMDSELGSRLVASSGNVMLIDNAPHPNAAVVYINWLMSQAGQTDWVNTTEQNSRRTDVPGPAESAAKPGVKYLELTREENAHFQERAIELAKEAFR